MTKVEKEKNDEETIICFCEDISKKEIIEAIEEGHTTLREIMRHLRAGMGECQGRGCMPQIIRLISRKTGKRPEKIQPLTDRPPIKPVPIGLLGRLRKRKVKTRHEKNEN